MKGLELKQIVPSRVCLSCEVCCRFQDKNSPFTPFLTQADLEALSGAGLPDEKINKNRFNLDSYKSFYACPCFISGSNKCSLYSHRPFECRLYPFLLAQRNKDIYLAVDKKCPFVGDGFINNNKSYIDYLGQILNSSALKDILIFQPELALDYSKDPDVVYIKQLDL